MNSNLHSRCQAAPYKAASSDITLLGWMKATLRDILIAAEVLPDVQFAAPWRDCQSSQSPIKQPIEPIL
jgi:hypothetical protein